MADSFPLGEEGIITLILPCFEVGLDARDDGGEASALSFPGDGRDLNGGTECRKRRQPINRYTMIAPPSTSQLETARDSG